MARQFAVFDIDGTIVRTMLLQLIVKELVNRGRIDGAAAGDIDRMLHDGRQRIADEDFGFYMKKGVEMMLQHAGGTLSVADYREASQAVARSLTSNTYVYTRQLIDTLRKNGFYLIAISGSEQYIVEEVSRALAFDTCAAHIKYLDDGTNLTGEIVKYNAKKDEILETIIQSHGLSKKGSMAIGDTSPDIAMFNLVEQPIAFNPDKKLFHHAKEQGWKVVVERKNMVYKLEPKSGSYLLA